MADSSVPGSGLGINGAALIQALAPIFLGSGKTTQVTGPQQATTEGTTTSGQTTSSSFDPSALAALNSIATGAIGNANNPDITNALVQNILTESAQAFAPVIAQQNSSGLYNTSTLANLSSEARARASAAAAQSVLNFQTSQQQVATNALNTVAANTKTSSTTGTQTNNSTTTQRPVTTTSIKAPTIDPVSSLLTIGGGFLGNKILGSGAVKGLTDSVGNAFTNGISSITDAIGLTGGGVGSLPSAAIVPKFASDAALDASGSLVGNAPAVTAATQSLDLSAAPAVQFGTDASSLIGAGAETAAEVAAPAAAEGVDAAAGLAAALPTDAVSGGLGGGAAAFTPAAAQDAIALDTQLAGGITSRVAGQGFATSLGSDLSSGVTIAQLEAANSAISSSALSSGFASDSAIAGGAGALLGATSDAALAAAAGEPEIAGALATLSSVGDIFAGAAGAAEGAGAAAAGGSILGEVLPEIASVIAWIICTELTKQGKMNATLYRYGYKKYLSYPEWGRYGYLLWARPTVKHMRKYPDGLVTSLMGWIFNLRINNIAAKAGCKLARWTMRGAVVSFLMELFCCILGLAIIPLRATTMQQKDWSV